MSNLSINAKEIIEECQMSGQDVMEIVADHGEDKFIHVADVELFSNNHDRMVEEIAELKEALPVIKQMIFSMKTNAHTFSNENVEEVSREGRSAMRLIDKLLAKLNQEGEG